MARHRSGSNGKNGPSDGQTGDQTGTPSDPSSGTGRDGRAESRSGRRRGASSFPTGYGTREAAEILGLSEAQVRGYVRAGFLMPRAASGGAYRFSFRDLVLLRTAKELASHLSARKVKRALKRLQNSLPHGRHLATVRVTVQGDDVVVHDADATWSATSGQMLLNLEVATLANEVAPLVQQAARRARESEAQLGADGWYELGCELESSDPDQARDAYRRALEVEPLHYDSHLNLGRLLHESGNLEAAEQHYRLALQTRPSDATAAFNLGVALQDSGHLDSALHAYAVAIAADPENADAHFNLSQIYEELGRPQRALRHLHIYRTLIDH